MLPVGKSPIVGHLKFLFALCHAISKSLTSHGHLGIRTFRHFIRSEQGTSGNGMSKSPHTVFASGPPTIATSQLMPSLLYLDPLFSRLQHMQLNFFVRSTISKFHRQLSYQMVNIILRQMFCTEVCQIVLAGNPVPCHCITLPSRALQWHRELHHKVQPRLTTWL